MGVKNFPGKIVYQLASLFLFMTSVCAAPSDPDSLGLTLCTADEDIYFSCPLPGDKIVSICASNNTSPTAGYVQYRYGTADNIEMYYPDEKVSPKNLFSLVDASEGSVNKNIIKFKNGQYTYLLSQAFVSYLTVLKGKKVVLRRTCNEGGYAFINRKADKGIHSINKSDEDFR
ncbi:hypothetical protein [Pseudomonas viridiflava]|uniref:hypothetical protein n=1 Tax=Pseudomonas viridiflava TaxID=33069 RepID=UPI000731DBD0|nr:hypothetical protein [Pseudomonas viridiflava]KTC15440.1 hypothetical protein AO390_03025 [Pseudomonas marginalis ICMP 11289]MEE4088891.1 hypothetical protein [Pseudomonas viridiflava]PCK92067.1 hypothetical protein PsyrCH409_10885 [Pseudomonas viridiflava]